MERILVVVDNVHPLSPCHDGLLIADRLAQRGFEVESVELRDPETRSESLRKTTWQINWPRRICMAAIQRLRRTVQRFRPDQVHLWGLRTGVAGRILRGNPTIELYRFDPLADSSGRTRWERMGDRSIRVLRWPNGGTRHLPWFRYDKVSIANAREEVRARLGIPADAHLISTISPHFPRAGIKDFLWAGDLLRNVRDDTWMVAAGAGPQTWRLKRYQSHLFSEDRIRIVSDSEDNVAIVAASDVYVQPSAWVSDCSGIRLARALRIPCIGIRHSIHERLIDPLRTGFLAGFGARNEVARCIQKVLTDPSMSASLREEAVRSEAAFCCSLDESIETFLRAQGQRDSDQTRAGAFADSSASS